MATGNINLWARVDRSVLLRKKNKKLTNYQLRVLQNVFSVCSTPLFCKLAFMESIKWRSYFNKDKTFLKRSSKICQCQSYTHDEATSVAMLLEIMCWWLCYNNFGDLEIWYLIVHFLPSSIEASIEFIFEKLEKKFGPVLIQHAFSYITASKVF